MRVGLSSPSMSRNAAAVGAPGERSRVKDQEIIDHISALAEEEQGLEERHVGTGLSADEQERRAELEVTLDRLWDLLRQRRALRGAGKDPDEAATRSEGTVEGYLQ